MFRTVPTLLKSQRDVTFHDCKSLCYLEIYTTHFMTCNTITVLAQFCMGHTAMKQKA